MAEENGGGRIDRLEGALVSLTSSVASLTDVTRLIAGQVNRLAELQIVTEDRVNELADQQRETNQALQRLVEAQQHSDEHLDTLLATMDDLIRRTTPPDA